jgi:MarR family transcriptional regulator, organic hydroperoxide resistance regulator
MRQAERLRFLALAVQREGNRDLQTALRPLGLTPAQAEALRIIGDHGPMSLGDVGERLVCEAGTNPSRLVDGLVRAGSVARTTDPNDRRGVVLELTADGRELETTIIGIESAMYERIDRIVDGLDVDALLDALGHLVEGTPSGSALTARQRSDGSGAPGRRT